MILRRCSSTVAAEHHTIAPPPEELCFDIERHVMSTPTRLFLLHIPKTAGTTLTAYVDDHFDVERILPRKLLSKNALYVRPQDFRGREGELAPYDLVRGHFGFPIWREFFAGHTLVTMLRDPVARVASLYHDWRSKSEENLAGAPPAEGDLARLARANGLAEFLAQPHPLVSRLFANGQARQLAGFIDDERTDDELLRRASDHLRQADLVGLTEFFDLSVACLARMFGWALPPQVERLNTSASRGFHGDVDGQTRAAIESMNAVDAQVYRLGSELFREQITRAFREMQDVRIAPPSNGAMQTSTGPVIVDMGGRFNGVGFHVREGVGGPKVWRWTGPGREARVELPLTPGMNYKLTVRVISVIEQDILHGAHVLAGGRDLAVRVADMEDGEHVLLADLPAERVAFTGPTQVSILVPRTMSHASVQPMTPDRREKGLAITRIVAEPVPQAANQQR